MLTTLRMFLFNLIRVRFHFMRNLMVSAQVFWREILSYTQIEDNLKPLIDKLTLGHLL